MRPEWRIYYDDGSTFDSEQGGPDDAPPIGVVVIATPYIAQNGKRVQTPLCEWDWYFYHLDRNEWWGVDEAGLHDHLLHKRSVVGAVLLGRMVGSDEFVSIRNRACEEIKWPTDTRISYVTSPQTPSRRTNRDP